MSWSFILIIGLVWIVILGLKRLGLVSAAEARKHLMTGALVVDVRTVEEFKAGHLAGAMNIPLGELQNTISHTVADKNQILLLHCLSGTRSGIARRMLRGLGYQNVFNLGSYGRAQRIVGQ